MSTTETPQSRAATPEVLQSRDHFYGYRRADGRFGVRNHLLVLSAAIYANATAQRVANNVLGAVAVTHPLGRCQVREDLQRTFETLVGTGSNPNVGAVIVIDHFKEEGCTAEEVAAAIREETGKPVAHFNERYDGGVIEVTAKATRAALQFLRKISGQQRERAGLRDLLFGLNCGTSDTTSGLSVNPALGLASDRIVAAGGRSILAEITELMGAEQWLADKAVDDDVAKKIWDVCRDIEEKVLLTGTDLRGSQPTGDNILGGLSTVEEKSLGGAKKSGSAPIVDVIDWAVRPRTDAGVYIMYTPGHGGESISGIAAGGSQLLVFTTGGGHSIAHPVMPTIKITANPASWKAMQDTVDLDLTGTLRGTMTLDEAGEAVLDEVLAVASGKLTKCEILREDTDFAINRAGIST
jgi:altronate dehydratase large subunit